MNSMQINRKRAYHEIFNLEEKIHELYRENIFYAKRYISKIWVYGDNSVTTLKDQCLVKKVNINDLKIERLRKIQKMEDTREIDIDIKNAKESLSVIIC